MGEKKKDILQKFHRCWINSYQEFDQQETKEIAGWEKYPTILFFMPPNYTVKKQKDVTRVCTSINIYLKWYLRILRNLPKGLPKAFRLERILIIQHFLHVSLSSIDNIIIACRFGVRSSLCFCWEPVGNFLKWPEWFFQESLAPGLDVCGPEADTAV